MYRNTEYQILNLQISKFLSFITGKQILILIDKFDFKSKLLAKSYNLNNFIYFNENNIIQRYRIYKIARLRFNNNDNINKL